MKNVKTNVNERVEVLRKKMGLTQQQFADLCRLTNTTVHRLEKGGNDPQPSTLSSIISGTGVSEKWLIDGEGELTFVKPQKKSEISDSAWKEEAYQKLEQQVAFLQGLVTQLAGGKGGNANFLPALDHNAAEGIIINLNELPFESRARA